MPRVKRSINAQKKRRKALDEAKGYWGLKKSSYRRAKEQLIKSGTYAYRDRRARKREFRRLWITRINAGAREHGLSYNQLIHGLEAGADRGRPQDAGRSGRARARGVRADGGSSQGSPGGERRPARLRCRRAESAAVIRDIAGRQNHSVKLARKLQQKKHRRERGSAGGRGDGPAARRGGGGSRCPRCAGAPGSGGRPAARPGAAGAPGAAAGDDAGPDIGVCDEETLDYASSLGGSADVIFTCAQPQWSLGDLDLAQGLTFFLDGVGDPGNVGTLVRSCVAFGAGGVVCSPGTADPYGPKAMRAGMGAQFALPVVTEVSAGRPAGEAGSLSRRGAQRPRRTGWPIRTRARTCGRLTLESGAIVVLGAERTGPGAEWEALSGVSPSLSDGSTR